MLIIFLRHLLASQSERDSNERPFLPPLDPPICYKLQTVPRPIHQYFPHVRGLSSSRADGCCVYSSPPRNLYIKRGKSGGILYTSAVRERERNPSSMYSTLREVAPRYCLDIYTLSLSLYCEYCVYRVTAEH